jgi:HlyD family secretion protein
VLQAEANVQRAEADIAQLTAKLDLAELELGRSSKLISKSAISPSDYDTVKVNFESAKASLAVGRAVVIQAKAAIDDARASVAKMQAGQSDAKVALETAEINLGYCTIRSPVDGIIIDRRVNVGQTVVASLNTPSLFLIAKDLHKVQVWASVNEADIGKVRQGLEVVFRVDAYPDKGYRGEVAQVRLNATMTQNVVTYTVIVTADNSDGLLLPYLTANVEIQVEQRKNVLLVPNSALRWQPEKEQIAPEYRGAAGSEGDPVSSQAEASNNAVLWTSDGSFVHRMPVKTGFSDGLQTEISGEGISEKMLVVIGVAQAESASDAGNPFVPQIPGKKKR